MNKKRILGLVRHVVGFALAYCVGKGYVDESQAAEIAAGLVALAVCASSWFSPEKKEAK